MSEGFEHGDTAMRIPDNLASEAKNFLESIDLEYVIASIPGHVYLKDANGAYIYANDRPSGLDSLSDGDTIGADFVGKTDHDFPWAEQAEKLRQHDRRAMRTGEPIAFKERGRLKDGQVHEFVSIKAPLRNKAGAIIGVIGVSVRVDNAIDA